jgi:basic amino acid/polyamine antiporter, APA family
MSWKEPYVALGLAAVWGLWGGMYFFISSKAKGRTTFIGEKEMAKIKV